ncbi:MAG: S4 domain-containing protein [Flavobacteriaceae bacterium]|nr:S4 domain-containing protein [Flavobacteriaceae bacterium]
MCSKSNNSSPKKSANTTRLNKFIANSGICSRREADMFIAMGMVKINGKIIVEMGYQVQPGDDVRYDGRRIISDKPAYVLLNKPKGFLASIKKGTYKKDVLELIENATPYRIDPVNAMDRTTSGLLLFTNDTELKIKLRKSSRGLLKIFQVILDKNLVPADLDKIRAGVLIDKFDKIEVDSISFIKGETKRKVGVELTSERHRAIFHLFEKLGYKVEQVDRVVYAHLTKKDLPRGKWRHLNEREINLFKMMK